jgi:hypothetical protein
LAKGLGGGGLGEVDTHLRVLSIRQRHFLTLCVRMNKRNAGKGVHRGRQKCYFCLPLCMTVMLTFFKKP